MLTKSLTSRMSTVRTAPSRASLAATPSLLVLLLRTPSTDSSLPSVRLLKSTSAAPATFGVTSVLTVLVVFTSLLTPRLVMFLLGVRLVRSPAVTSPWPSTTFPFVVRSVPPSSTSRTSLSPKTTLPTSSTLLGSTPVSSATLPSPRWTRSPLPSLVVCARPTARSPPAPLITPACSSVASSRPPSSSTKLTSSSSSTRVSSTSSLASTPVRPLTACSATTPLLMPSFAASPTVASLCSLAATLTSHTSRRTLVLSAT
mmetsp:Transcript_13544/g.23332  ORF Transcript_13544/g.23332 Transcript_13544/m.23332 type:complete len:258 (-) Transcript_13544:5339-6112(-)